MNASNGFPQARPSLDAAVAELRAELGNTAVLAESDIPDRNTHDWSTLAPKRPLAVVRPADTAGVAAAMRICARHRIAVVPQGGLTGLCGGARPSDGAVALSLERMSGIEEIDAASATITVKAGTPLQAVQQAADEAGFFMPLDLGSRGSCSIGGNLSTNAGGNRVVRYGMARELVLGLEVVLADGTVVTSLNKMMKNNAGYDLKQLFIGSEGTLGIITRVVMKLSPKPRCTTIALCGLESYAALVELLNGARQGLGSQLSAFEVMWPDYWRTVTEQVPGVRAPIAGTHACYALIEAQGTDAEIDAPRFEAWLAQQLERGIVADAALAQSLADAQAFWGVRDACAEFPQVLGPHESFDIGLPVASMDAFVSTCSAALRERFSDVVALFYGHIGDGNLHIVSCVPGVEPQPKDVITSIVYEQVRAFHGTISAEHGIGETKRRWLHYTRNEAELELMRRIKTALDPDNLLNPGKVL
jgi:FAD/FMN-containing dehydrogenase